MSKGLIQLLGIVAVFILLGFIFTDIYAYFAISLIIAAILKPVSLFFKSIQIFGYRVPKIVSVFMSFLLLGVVVFLFVLLFVPLISDQVKILSELDYSNLTNRLGQPLKAVEDFLITNELTQEKEGFIIENIQAQIRGLISQLDFGNLFNALLGLTGTVFVGVLAVGFITFFLLYQSVAIRRWLISLLSNKYFEVTIAALNKIERLLSNYLLGISLQMIAIFLLASLGLSLIGLKYAVTIAMFAAVANIIPYLGPLLGSIFAVLVGVTVTQELQGIQDYLFLIGKIISVFAIVQVTDNVLWQPLIFSKSVKAHPLEIFIIIFAGATLAGIVGMIAAIPVYTVIRVSFIEFYTGSRKYRVFKLQKVKF